MNTALFESDPRLGNFKTLLINHPHLRDAYDEVRKLTASLSRPGIVVVAGPTGAGKTTLLEKVQTVTILEYEPLMQQDGSFLPVISVVAPAPERGNFDWSDFYVRCLQAMAEPMIELKRVLPQATPITYAPHTWRSTAALRRMVECALHHRHVKLILIDEGQHITKTPGGRRLRDHMDALKFLAEISQAVVVITGTYEVLDCAVLSAQLARRTACVHLPRYRADNPDEIYKFQVVLKTFADRLPRPLAPGLLEQWQFFYKWCAGCIGVLKVWLDTALAEACRGNSPVIDREILSRVTLSPQALRQIAQEAQEGETRWANSMSCDAALERQLGLPLLLKSQADASAGNKSPPPARRVGIRKPHRDPVGPNP